MIKSVIRSIFLVALVGCYAQSGSDSGNAADGFTFPGPVDRPADGNREETAEDRWGHPPPVSWKPPNTWRPPPTQWKPPTQYPDWSRPPTQPPTQYPNWNHPPTQPPTRPPQDPVWKPPTRPPTDGWTPPNNRPTNPPTSFPSDANAAFINTETYRRCYSSCGATSEYAPVCGSDNQVYQNRGRLNCAIRCGNKITYLHDAPCPPLGS